MPEARARRRASTGRRRRRRARTTGRWPAPRTAGARRRRRRRLATCARFDPRGRGAGGRRRCRGASRPTVSMRAGQPDLSNSPAEQPRAPDTPGVAPAAPPRPTGATPPAHPPSRSRRRPRRGPARRPPGRTGDAGAGCRGARRRRAPWRRRWRATRPWVDGPSSPARAPPPPGARPTTGAPSRRPPARRRRSMPRADQPADLVAAHLVVADPPERPHRPRAASTSRAGRQVPRPGRAAHARPPCPVISAATASTTASARAWGTTVISYRARYLVSSTRTRCRPARRGRRALGPGGEGLGVPDPGRRGTSTLAPATGCASTG